MSEYPPEVYDHLQSLVDGTCRVWIKPHHDLQRIEVCADDPKVLPWVSYCVENGLTDWHRDIHDQDGITLEEEDKYVVTGKGLAALWEHKSTNERHGSQYVTLLQVAPLVNRSKRTLEAYKSIMPAPAVEGGGRGKADEWLWDELRPWLEKHFDRKLPTRFPSLNPPYLP